MEVWVNLKFGDGDFEQGFNKIQLQIDAFSNETNITQLETQLPPAPEIPSCYESWKKIYDLLAQPTSRGFKNNQVTNVSTDVCSEYAKYLREKLNQWLVPIKSQLEPVITSNTNADIRLIVNTHGVKSELTKNILHRIPWQECHLFGEHSSLETALSFKYSLFSSDGGATKPNSETFRRIKIISIFGDSINLDTSTDEKLIIDLEKRGAETIFLKEPKRETLHKLWDDPCDILFFAGHSESQEDGKKGIIAINPNDSLDLEEIPRTLKSAISKGLKLAIFNSCDGLGLAQRLADLNLPYVIVWREPVPDKIAQQFLNFFLSSYAGGDSLFTSVFKARGKLQELTGKSESEKPLPGVSCLPIICKNTLELPPSWEDLGGLSGKLPDCPYQGLSAFGEEDAPFFFGREKFVDQLVTAVQSKSLVTVVGASGSGKSSAVFAGLVPSLRKIGNVEIISFRPGNNPLGNLAIALNHPLNHHCHSPVPLQGENSIDTQHRLDQMVLEVDLRHDETKLCDAIASIVKNLTPLPPFPRREGGSKSSPPLAGEGLGERSHLVLIADQFEELYTLTPQEERQHFLDALIYAIAHAPKFILVLTLRADFYGYALSYRPFSDALQKGIYNLGPMNWEELRSSVEKPAHKMKVELEEGLAETLIKDLGNEPGRLPLLEFTLMQLWQNPRKWFLTHEAYQEIGGLEKALANYANTVLDKLSQDDRKRAEKIFIQLVRPGEGTEDTRRVATRKEVGDANWDLVQQLADARLLVTSCDEISENKEETVEIIHEALIREWGTFRQWIQDNREFRTWQERLKPNVREWQDHQYNSGRLLQETPLNVALKWYSDRIDELTLQEKEFIEASAEKQNKQEREKKRRNQLTILGLTTGLAITLFLAALSEISRTDAEASRLSTTSEKYFNQNDHEGALAGAIKAGKLVKNSIWKSWIAPETRMQVVLTLREIVYDYRVKNFKGHTHWVNGVSFSKDSKIVASASFDGTVKLWDVTTGQDIKTLKGHKSQVTSVSFSPNGKTIASASFDGTVKLWDVKTDREIKTFKGHNSKVLSVSFANDGKIVASASSDKTVKLWDVTTGQEVETFKGHVDEVWGVSFSPNDKTVASVSSDKTVKLWDVTTGQEIKTLKGHNSKVLGVSFSPDSKIVASASEDTTVKLWNVTTGRDIKTLKGHRNWVYGVSFSPDGKTVASASSDKTIKLWDVKTGQEVETFNGHADEVNSVSFSNNGKSVASASRDQTVKVWDLTTAQKVKILEGHNSQVLGVSFSPNGKIVASASEDKTVKLWDVTTGQKIKTLKGHISQVLGVSFSPDGKTVASASEDKTVKLWNVTTGQEIKTFKGHRGKVRGASFSPDGKTIASASEDSTVKLWNVTTGQEVKTLKGHISQVLGVSFSPDGKTVASASEDSTVKLWNIATGQVIKTLKGHIEWVYGVSFSPNNKIVASASSDGTVKLWDVITGRDIGTLKGHTDEVISVSFSPDGETVASASRDKTVKLWDVTTGREIKTLEGHKDWVNNVSFSPDAKTVASASKDGTVILWNFDLDNLLVQGCDLIQSYLRNNFDVNEGDRKLCDRVGKKH
ncbi:MAG: CHAT domain-containing protein [Pelatocladus maniniholoensis HA4357-MV3]|jgi:WD40 repeat protein|uniref:CHAT domain-containing protein n=1 Tax=Pelatocladus maniniholoensis HA4357-MV3 TaxID=1117104 RepID=A0A9E3H380_9NOST|nr:CHAT domain-containing protein [Pelatocladus maniniholoensis HA4357-MV3]